jgi:peptidoglycan/xylan/chitin deacetylase (PgdA/CDA1 family)
VKTRAAGGIFVSVIMPAYNAAGTILASLGSVRRQTSPDWELIVVDDGSADDTAARVRRACEEDSRIRYVRQANGGVCSARNRGRAMASFDWLLHLDADDRIESTHLERMTSVLASDTSLDAVQCGWVRVTPDGRRVDEHFHEGSGDLFNVFTRCCAFAVHACIVRRSLVEAVGGWDTSLRTCEDWDLWQRVARTGARFGELHEVLALSSMRPGSASQDGRRYMADGVRVISQAHASDPRVQPDARHAAGAPGGELPNALFDFVSWPAALVLGAGEDARSLLDELLVAEDPTLDADSVAQCILTAALLPHALPPEAWPDLWPTIEARLEPFLIALEQRSRAHGLALRARRTMLEHIVQQVTREHGGAATVPDRLMNIEVTEPLPTIGFSAGGAKVLAMVKVEGTCLGPLWLRVAGECGPWLFADAVAADYAWDILGAFFGRTVYRQLEVTAEPERAVMRGDLCLVDRLSDGDALTEIHTRAGWTVFLQELWGRPAWPMSAFYDEHTPDADAPLRHVGAERVVIDICDELPDLHVEGGYTTLDVRIGGSSLGWMTLQQDGPRVRAQQLRARLTKATGRELCHVAVREALVGTRLTGDTLRTRLSAARTRPTALPANTVVIARRRAGIFGASTSRRAVFPAAAAEDLLAAAAARGDAVPGKSALASITVARVVYAPDVVCAASAALGPVAPPPKAKPAPRGRSSRRLPILMYHRVADGVRGDAARYCVSPGMFESHLRVLREVGAYGITLDDWRVAREERNPIEGFPILITFDDAYADFGQQAWPLLKRNGFPAHLFVVTGEVGRHNAWDSPPGEAVPLLGWDELRRLRDEGVEIGSHSVTHADLTTLSQADIIREATRSQVSIVRELSQTPLSFAYPYGAMDAFVANAIGSCGFVYGFSCRPGPAGHKDPLVNLPRIEVLGTDTAEDLKRKIGL